MDMGFGLTLYRFFYASAKPSLSSVLCLVSELMPKGYVLKRLL